MEQMWGPHLKPKLVKSEVSEILPSTEQPVAQMCLGDAVARVLVRGCGCRSGSWWDL